MAGSLIPLFYFIMKLLGRRIRPLSGAVMDQYGKTFAIVEENLNLLPIIKSFTREPLESSRFAASNTRLSQLIRQYQRIQSLLSPVIQFLAALAFVEVGQWQRLQMVIQTQPQTGQHLFTDIGQQVAVGKAQASLDGQYAKPDQQQGID